jgi:hypothetical protein
MTATDELRQRKATLETRLEDGDRRIRAAEQQGKDVTAWEDFWLTLLAEYEAVMDELQETSQAVR